MKKILIIHQNLELGGAETSLIGLLWSLDYSSVSVDLFLYEVKGELLRYLPPQVTLLDEKREYKALVSPMVAAARSGQYGIAVTRAITKARNDLYRCFFNQTDVTYILKQRYHKNCLWCLPHIEGEYDLAVSFNDPHYVVVKKTNAKVKVGWFHTDCSRIRPNQKIEKNMWLGCDCAVNVSEDCKNAFIQMHPYMKEKSVVIENILSKELIYRRADEFDASFEMVAEGTIRLLSIGRFSEQKNFDNVPAICKLIREKGCNVVWYLVGYGNDEELIRKKIAENGMEEYVVILGKKENPYPYIKACDYYVQPSRYEGKCVAVREAQILHKPVIITNYATASSQLTSGYDGIVVPLDNVGCANGIVAALRNELLKDTIVGNVKANDYTNSSEVDKVMRLMVENV